MKLKNKKKLAVIKSKILNNMFTTMSKNCEDDKDYKDALRILADAMQQVENLYGQVD